MAQPRFYAKRNDTRPIRMLAQTEGGNTISLSGATARFHLANDSGGLVVDAAATVFGTVQTDEDGNEYNLQYAFGASDLDLAPGQYRAEFEVTDSSGFVSTYPTRGYISFVIEEDLD